MSERDQHTVRSVTVARMDNGFLVQVRANDKLIGHYAFATGRAMLALFVTIMSIDGDPDKVECGRCKGSDTTGEFIRYCTESHCPLKGYAP